MINDGTFWVEWHLQCGIRETVFESNSITFICCEWEVHCLGVWVRDGMCRAWGRGDEINYYSCFFFQHLLAVKWGARPLGTWGWIDCGGEMGERATSRMFLRFVAFFSLVLRIDGYWATASPTTAAWRQRHISWLEQHRCDQQPKSKIFQVEKRLWADPRSKCGGKPLRPRADYIPWISHEYLMNIARWVSWWVEH